MITYDTTQDDGQQIGVGLGCNGIIDVLFTPLDHNDAANPVNILSGLTNTRLPQVVVCITGCAIKLNALGNVCLYENDEQFVRAFIIKNIAGEVLQVALAYDGRSVTGIMQ